MESKQTLEYPLAKTKTSRLCLGCMRHSFGWKDTEAPPAGMLERARSAVETALELGWDFFDHADIYGAGKSERLFGQIMKDLGLDRKAVKIQTKCGIRFPDNPEMGDPHRFDFSKEHILYSVDQSLERLGTDYIDILLLHRPDLLGDTGEIGEAFQTVFDEGKVRAFGVSNFPPALLDLYRAKLPFPLVANQVELSLLKTSLVDCSVVSREGAPAGGFHADGSLEYHRKHEIVTQAWAPMAYGKFSGGDLGEDEAHLKPTARLVAEIAGKYGVDPITIVIAWILRHPANIQPVIGSLSPERLRASHAAVEIELDRRDWYRLYTSSRGSRLP